VGAGCGNLQKNETQKIIPLKIFFCYLPLGGQFCGRDLWGWLLYCLLMQQSEGRLSVKHELRPPVTAWSKQAMKQGVGRRGVFLLGDVISYVK
jgi:hypothetical protein